MDWEWEQIGAHYRRLFDARKATQEATAHAGGLVRQNQISRVLSNKKNGPSLVIFLKAVIGLGMQPSEFFADLERYASGLELASPRLVDVPRVPSVVDPSRFAAAQAAFWRVLAEPKPSPRKRARRRKPE